jgi:hypothetical protein
LLGTINIPNQRIDDTRTTPTYYTLSATFPKLPKPILYHI